MPQLSNKKKSAPNLLSEIDFGLEICKEKIPDNGEDSFLYMFTPDGGIIGVFDGCGGSGAKKYEKYQGKTGAYMASRAVSGAARDWFIDSSKSDICEPENVSGLKLKIEEYLKLCRDVGGGTTAIKGSISKDFPTTAAVMLISANNAKINASCLWAGDSRCYLLDAEGLKQLTNDDLGGLDPMENLTADGVLTNVVSLSKDFELHCKTIAVSKPAILFAATDGCFGYFSTPMEFEYLLLSSLYSADSIEHWEDAVSGVLLNVAGDDFSLSGVALGFVSFVNLKKTYEKRFLELVEKYIKGIKGKTKEEKIELWQFYRPEYTKYMSEE